jgi:hypothetical protein
MADDDPTRSQQILDHAQAERKSKVQPDGVCDDFDWETMATIAGVSNFANQAGVTRNSDQPVNVTVPLRDNTGRPNQSA